MTLYCTVCRQELSPELVRKNSACCSRECKNARNRIRRAEKKQRRRCSTCGQKILQNKGARVRKALEEVAG